MSKIAKRVQIDGKWYDVSEGWAGTLHLSQWMSPVAYTTRNPYPVLHPDLYSVHDTNGNKVGEFRLGDWPSYSGGVTGLEVETKKDDKSKQSENNGNESSGSGGNEFGNCIGCLGIALLLLFSALNDCARRGNIHQAPGRVENIPLIIEQNKIIQDSDSQAVQQFKSH
jgi:hypothetical protein